MIYYFIALETKISQCIMSPCSSNDILKSLLQLYFLVNHIHFHPVLYVYQYFVKNSISKTVMDAHDCCSAGRTTHLYNYQYLHGSILIHVHRVKLKVVPGAQSMVSLPRMNCLGLSATPSGHTPVTNSRSSSMHCRKAR